MVVDSRLTIEGHGALPPTSTYVDSYGNRCRRITLNDGETTVRFLARVDVGEDQDETSRTPTWQHPRTFPTMSCTSSCPVATANPIRSPTWPGRRSARSVGLGAGPERVRLGPRSHTFQYGSSSPGYSALSILERRVGVCRDFTHLAIALCRSVNIPARYVFGYLPDIGVPDSDAPNDFCAWMEVFLGGRWFTFDPRNNQHRIGRVVIGRGRDAADVAMVTSFGRIEMLGMTVRAEVGWGQLEPMPRWRRNRSDGLPRHELFTRMSQSGTSLCPRCRAHAAPVTDQRGGQT